MGTRSGRAAAAAAAVLVFGTAACGGGGTDDEGSSSPSSEASTTTTEAAVFDPDAVSGGTDEDGGGGDDGGGGSDLNAVAGFVDDAAEYATPLPDRGEPEIEDFTEITDATGRLSLEVPGTWTDQAEETDERPGPYVAASPDLDDLAGTWGVPGAVLYVTALDSTTSRGAFEQFNEQEVGTDLGNVVLDYCSLAFAQSYERSDAEFTVAYYDDCDSTETDYVVAWLAPAVGPIVALDMQLVTQADNAALTRALETFTIDQDAY